MKLTKITIEKKMLIELILKFLLGGTIIVIFSLLAKSKNPQIAGLVVLFPIISVVGYIFLINSIGKEASRPIILFSVIALPTVLVFLVSLFFSLKYFNTFSSFSISIFCWFITAILIYLADKHIFHLYIKNL